MKRDNVNYLLVGSFVLLMGAVLFYALYRITGHSSKGDIYTTHFANVAGIKEGSVVTYEGFEVGNVAEVSPVERNKHTAYRLTLNIRKPVNMPVDSLAIIATPGLLSAPLIEIKEGKATELLAAGSDIPGGGSVNLMESVAALATDLGKITETSIKPLLAQINKDISPAMSDLRSMLEKTNRAAGRVEALFNDENVKHWSRLLQNADGASANALKLSADLASLRTEMEGLVKDSRGLVANTGNVVTSTGVDLKESLRRVDATLYQLESAGRNINEFSRTIRENPAALINSRPPIDNAGAPQ